ncbi:hypothetical protein LAV73_22515 [Lysinibacillus xylanilyticus]|nr:hypothetical protein [Lysinibacillus xylanilyticus]MEB2282700.1 hypothetical protein [Lysinibacillus xylanilyticus]
MKQTLVQMEELIIRTVDRKVLGGLINKEEEKKNACGDGRQMMLSDS